MRKIWVAGVALVVLASLGQLAAAEKNENKFFFQKGDRIVFLGDSITEQYQYSTDIELYLTTRYPKWNLTFINAGIGGDTSTGGASRFKDHVLSEKPTAVTIDFGMNDGRYGAFHQALCDQYIKHTEDMLKAAKKADVRVALISPNAVDIRPRPNLKMYLDTQKKFYAPLKELAEKYKVPFVDQYAITRAALDKITKDNATKVQPFPDGVHTSGMGGLLMAHTILVGLHAPALVSDVEIDVTNGKAKTKACTVANLKSGDKRIAFERTDEALPLPVQKDWEPILPYVKELKDLNWYGLKVKGLAAGKYTLLIDGKDVASFTSDQLAEGVNLGNLTTGPIHAQGAKVFQAIIMKNGLVHKRFREVRMFHAPDWLADVVAERKPKELEKRMKQIEESQEAIYKLALPAAHQFELKLAQ
jgi:lysophospholipase L1-like esterase